MHEKHEMRISKGKGMYQKHEMNIIGFDKTDVFADGVWIGSQPVLDDDDDGDR